MLITPIEPGQPLHITGNSTSHIEAELSTAVVFVRQQTHQVRQGILITRFGPGTYTGGLDASVPYGVTDERDTWTSREQFRDPGALH
jgi:hypothetical protein